MNLLMSIRDKNKSKDLSSESDEDSSKTNSKLSKRDI